MRILVIGKEGQLAKCLRDTSTRFSHEVYFTSRNDLDITNSSLIEENILKYNPEIIINCSAFTAVDRAEKYEKEAFAINSEGVKGLAKICKKYSIYLVHISTDYVFDGKGTDYFKESTFPNPSTAYGKSKLSGENAVIESDCEYIIIRTSWLFSEYGNNFLRTMLMLAQKNNSLRIVSDQFGCPTYAQDLAFAIFSAVPLSKTEKRTGLYHFGGSSSCSWDIFAEEIFKEAFKRKIIKQLPAIERVDSEDFVSLAERPRNSRLDSSLFYSTFKVRPSDWRKGIKTTLERIEK